MVNSSYVDVKKEAYSISECKTDWLKDCTFKLKMQYAGFFSKAPRRNDVFISGKRVPKELNLFFTMGYRFKHPLILIHN